MISHFLVHHDFLQPIQRDSTWHNIIAWMDEYRDIRLLWNFGDLVLSVLFVVLFYYIIRQMSQWKRCSFEKHKKLTDQLDNVTKTQEQLLFKLKEEHNIHLPEEKL